MPRKKVVQHNTISYELDDAEWELAVKMVIMHTMLALYKTGYREVNLAGLMLLMGFDPNIVKDHFGTFVKLDENFEEYVTKLDAKIEFEDKEVPNNVVWH